MLFFLVAGMAAEYARRGKFAQLVSDHVFRNVNRDELITIVHSESVAYEIRRNHRSARPSLDNLLLAALLHFGYFLLQLYTDIWAFF